MSARNVFSSDDKIINQNNNTEQIEVKNVEEYFEIERCADTILRNKYSVVALQFPDELLSYANHVSKSLKNLTKMKVYILADTSYGSCCVDEVSASHYAADVIVHYGPSCLSSPEKIPVVYVYGQGHLDSNHFIDVIKQTSLYDEEKLLLFFDVQYAKAVEQCNDELQANFPNIVISTIAKDNIETVCENQPSCGKFGRNYNLNYSIEKYKILFIGYDGRTLYNLIFSYNKNEFYSYNPSAKILRKEDMNVSRYLMRRYYLIEKAKDAQFVGIIMGTLGVARYREMLSRTKRVLKVAGKKCYTFIVGKVNPAKLANFMEIDIFVLIACPENSLIDSKEFYKPIVTPYEMEIACLKARSWTGDYVTDFRDLLTGCVSHVEVDNTEVRNDDDEPEYSFITGNLRICKQFDDTHNGNSNEIVARNQDTTVATIHPISAGEYLSSRIWHGLQVDSGNTEVKKAVEGRAGIAMSYKEEGEK